MKFDNMTCDILTFIQILNNLLDPMDVSSQTAPSGDGG